ncbi:MAG TPA: HAMP domain-containing sensor histidine kinase [Polyangiaceae bacterium]|jgi:signal transduction histidine kinase|nr:HAMP domain-containing sensor histidine kinase [Polyangiaceae bacterium]
MKPTRLVISIYLVALVQVLTAWLGFSVSRDYMVEPPGRLGRGGFETFAAQHVAFDRNNPAALAETMEWLRVEIGIKCTLFEPSGEVIASTHEHQPPALAPNVLRSLPVHGFIAVPGLDTYAVGIYEHGKLVAYVITDRFELRRPLSRQFILIGALLSFVLLGSLLFARSLARPLRHLARVAREFGGGKLTARARLDRRDELGAVATAFDDMAERITALLHGQRELLANVSHELRTPLARIRVALDLAAEGDAEAARDALAHISTDWGDLDRLVEDVLAAARLDLASSEPGALPLRRDEVDMAELAEAAVERAQLSYPGERFELEVGPELPLIEGDASLLRRVVDNLMDNARKYSEPNSPVLLRVRREGSGVLLAVIDRGMGIEGADLPHIFTPFFRADRSRTRKTGGVGLGLTLVRRIVTAHGGSVEVKSRVSQGTEMYIHLPRDGSRAALPSEPCEQFRTPEEHSPQTSVA